MTEKDWKQDIIKKVTGESAYEGIWDYDAIGELILKALNLAEKHFNRLLKDTVSVEMYRKASEEISRLKKIIEDIKKETATARKEAEKI